MDRGAFIVGGDFVLQIGLFEFILACDSLFV